MTAENRHWKYGCIVLLVVTAMLLIGCDAFADRTSQPVAPSATPTAAQPVVVSMEIHITPEPFVPTPEPTPTPSPSPIPFSYYAPSVNMSFEELFGGYADSLSDDDVIWPKGYPAPDTYRITVDLYWQVVMVYSKDENGEYTVPVRYMLCSTGSPKIGSETAVGEFPMKKTKVRFGAFAEGDAAQYWSLIRSRTYFHSVLYEKRWKLNTYDLESYENLGSKASHACIRLTVPDARWIWYNICYDTICEIRKGSSNDVDTRAIREQLVLPTPPASRITLTAGQTPDTDNWRIEDVATDYPFINEAQPKPPSANDNDDDGYSGEIYIPPSSGDSGDTGDTGGGETGDAG